MIDLNKTSITELSNLCHRLNLRVVYGKDRMIKGLKNDRCLE